MPLLSFLFFNNEKVIVSNNSNNKNSQTATRVKNKRLLNVKRFNSKMMKFTSEEELSNWTKTWELLKQLATILTSSKKTNIYNLIDFTNYDSFQDIDTDSDTDTDVTSFCTTRSSLSYDMDDQIINKSSICDLFPKKANIQNLDFASAVPCSMNISLMENPIKFATLPNGMISSILSNDKQSFQTSSINNSNNSNNNNSFLPISPQSNDSANSLNDELTPQSIIPLGKLSNSTGVVSNTDLNYQATTLEKEEPYLFICHYCDATFRIRGYLTRHIKKHAIEKAYHCPFYDKNMAPELRCHSTGGFSRRDTYKTHLKARHFTFPSGVKAHDRNKSDGKCSHCGEHFMSADDWISNHLETGKCAKLPEEYLIALKEKSKNKKKSHHKLKMIKTSTGHSRFVSSVESIIEQKVLQNKEALEAIAIVAGDSMNNHVLSKNEQNQFVLNSENFEGHKKPKKKYRPRKNKQTTNSNISRSLTNDTVSLESNISNNNNSQFMNGISSFINSPDNLMLSNATNLTQSNNNPGTIPNSTNMNGYIGQQDILMNSSLMYTFVPITTTSSISSLSSTSSLFLEPLDIEQQSMYEPFEELIMHNNSVTDNSRDGSTNKKADIFTYKIDSNKFNGMQMEETRRYFDLYNFLLGSNLSGSS